MTEPSLGEVLRRLDEVSRQMLQMSGEMRADRIENATTYVRKDVYKAEVSDGLGKRVTDLEVNEEAREKESRDSRRQLLFIVLGASIPALLALLLSVNTYLAAGGK